MNKLPNKILIVILFPICFYVQCYELSNVPSLINRKLTILPYSEIGIDTLQQTIINSEQDMVYVYGDDRQSELAGLCLRAFTAWVKQYTNNDSLQVKVIETNNGYRNTEPISPWAYQIDEKTEDEFGNYLADRELMRANEYFEQAPFDFITPYNNITLNNLISPNSCIINLRINNTEPMFTGILINMQSIYPNPKEYDSWLFQEYYYIFRPKFNGSITSWNEQLIDSLKKNQYYLINSDNYIDTNRLTNMTKWGLFELSCKPAKYFSADNFIKLPINEAFKLLKEL